MQNELCARGPHFAGKLRVVRPANGPMTENMAVLSLTL